MPVKRVKRVVTPFRIGDCVRLNFGGNKVTGIVVLERGPFGTGGRHLYRVEIPADPYDPIPVELSEEGMELIPPGSEPAPTISHAHILQFMVEYGLVSLLYTSLNGRDPSRVWLCLDTLGNVTHTFKPDRSIVGGQVPPLNALDDDKIIPSKRQEVVDFVTSFGLTPEEAEKVVEAVGVAKPTARRRRAGR